MMSVADQLLFTCTSLLVNAQSLGELTVEKNMRDPKVRLQHFFTALV
jgi:hypothetical protein